MKIIFSLILLFNFLFFCNAQKKTKPVGAPERTFNPNTPIIYKRGYKDFNIIKIPVAAKKDTLHELRFNNTYFASYTQQMMFDNFGVWDKEIRPNNEEHPILVWEKRRLFPNKNTLYTIYAGGEEKFEGIYSCVLVYDDEKDCLTEHSPDRNKITEYFADGIKNLRRRTKFYDVYWGEVDKYNKSKEQSKKLQQK
ncbi:hypothetical protein A0O34_03885 [Chryseobacterium glaciei]|uniref:Uncharacterized protein n=1 Tax=Chryseobacterium glaciei TaxID=1685010 RepID=A0A172XSB3_9FLAO|nr:hypothetical protein [Chryseobacterium glaciei]ANF49732.1 hypothetical protein A0O34_03885 [Chryseobacterium glaciei]